MLQRSSQVGEFYRMAPPAVFDETKPLPASYMDVMIYDEEGDKLVHIEFEQALRACCIQNMGPADIKKLVGDTAALKAATDQKHGAKLAGGGKQSGDLGADASGADLLAWLIATVKAGMLVEICITIARPFIEHHMLSAVAAVSGRDTGATLYGPADMQISANTSVKTIEGHFTCYTKSLVTKPQNVMVLRDIMCNGYVAGGNTKFFGATGKLSDTNPLTGDMVRNAIQERLAYTDDLDADYGSMLAFLSSYNEMEVGSRDQVISLSDRLLPWEVTKGPGTSKGNGGFPGGQAGYEVYRGMYGLDQIHFGEDVRAAENMEFIANVRFKTSNFKMESRAFLLKIASYGFLCIFFTLAGIHEQLDLHHWPAPQVLSVQVCLVLQIHFTFPQLTLTVYVFSIMCSQPKLLRAHPWPGPLWSRYATPLSNTFDFNPTFTRCESASNQVPIRFSCSADAIPGVSIHPYQCIRIFNSASTHISVSHFPFSFVAHRMPGGGEARRCRSSRHAIRWSRSRLRRTRSSRSARPTRSKHEAAEEEDEEGM